MITDQFKKDLVALGVKKGDSVMIHCSYKAMGTEISPFEIFDCLKEILGEEGTLILPAFSYDTVDYKNLIFDRENTPSCIGFLPEFFRTQVDGVVRSIHATHSCCVCGKNAEYLIRNHDKDITPVGENSPLRKLPELDGKILILGSHPDHNTALHGVEELGDAPYIFDKSKSIEYILKDGETEIHQKALRHDFYKKDCYYAQKYARIIDVLSKEDYTFGKVLKADCYLMSAKAVWQKGVEKLKEDPYFFVDKVNL